MAGKQFPIILIEARITDMPRIAELAGAYKYTGSKKKAPLVFNSYDCFRWFDTDKMRMICAVDSGGEVFGVMGVCTRKKNRSQLWLSFLVVDPVLQRLGIGRKLFSHAIGIAAEENLGEIVTEAHTRNRDLIHFLTAMGFTAKRKNKSLTFGAVTIGILAFTYTLPVTNNESN